MKKLLPLLLALVLAPLAVEAASVTGLTYSSSPPGIATGAIPKNGSTNDGTTAASALTDNGTIVSSSESLDVAGNAIVTEVANDGTTGTTLNKLAKLTTASPATAIITATTDTSGIVGVVIGGAATTSNAKIAVSGQASCVFDGATTAGDFVQNSSTVAGDCKDAGSTYPISGQVLGRVLSTNVGGGTYAMVLFSPGIQAAAGGATRTMVSSGGGLSALSTTATKYFGFSASGNELSSQSIPVLGGTIKNLYIVFNNGVVPGGTGSYTLTLRKIPSGTGTPVSLALTCTVTSAASTCNDTTHTDTVAVGDTIDVQAVPVTSPSNAPAMQWMVELDPQ